jgi:hypothetical protein
MNARFARRSLSLAALTSLSFFIRLPAANNPPPTESESMQTSAVIRPVEDLRTPRYWITPEYMHYWEGNAGHVPVLASSSTDPANPWALPSRGGVGVYGGNDLRFNDGNGGRLTLGAWLDENERFGFEASGFYIPKQTLNTTVSTDGSSSLAAPFTDSNPTNGPSNSVPIGGIYDSGGATGVPGSATFRSTTEQYGGQASFLLHVVSYKPTSDFLVNEDSFAGFRYLAVNDDFEDSYQGLNTFGGQNFAFGASDKFTTDNNFYGVNIGVHLRASYHGFFAELTPQFALGAMIEDVNVSGNAFTGGSGMIGGLNAGLTGNPGGLYAIGNKLGDRSQDKFTYVPQVTFKLGYDIKNIAEIFVAYDAMYISEVARAADQVDTNIDSSVSPLGSYYFADQGASAPGGVDHSAAPRIMSSSLFEQGISAGATIKF